MGDPVFYFQDRVGRKGKTFRFWKLRSMVMDADAPAREAHLAASPQARMEWAHTQKLKDDSWRITSVGRFIRKTSLDELPQIRNVLKGDMSLVGPRPIMPEQRALYRGRAYFQLRPGITGFWQIGDRNDTAFWPGLLRHALCARPVADDGCDRPAAHDPRGAARNRLLSRPCRRARGRRSIGSPP